MMAFHLEVISSSASSHEIGLNWPEPFGAGPLQRRPDALGRVNEVGIAVHFSAGDALGVGMVGVALDAHHLAVLDARDERAHVGAIVRTDDSNGRLHDGFSHPPHSNGEVPPSYGDGGVRSICRAAPDPTVRDYAGTFPCEWGGAMVSDAAAYQRRAGSPALLLLGGSLSRLGLDGLRTRRLGAGAHHGGSPREPVMPKRSLKRWTRPPRSMLWRTPVQAGWVLGSMSRRRLRAFLAPGRTSSRRTCRPSSPR